MPIQLDLSVQKRTRPDGQIEVAIAHYAPITISTTVGPRTYSFNYKNNVALAWVLECDLPQVLDVSKTCCGGRKKRIFRYANRQQVNIHMTGDPRKDWDAK